MIVAVGLLAAKMARAEAKNTSVIFLMVSNPVREGLSGDNIAGVSRDIPISRQFAKFKELIPTLKTLGVIYNPAKSSAVSEQAPAAAKQLDDNFQLAYKLMSSAKARDAFALEKETQKVRDRYGRTRFGQSCLMARRLIEAGVRFVTVNMFETVFDEVTWDIHGSRPFTDVHQMAKEVAPNFDTAYTALLEDLAERGLLANTMVIALGEFGRTPKINPAGGRDHHPGVWSILIGGGPIKGGQVVGESDELAYAPKTRPVMPGEVAATLYRGLGLDPHKELPGPQNRPIPMVDYNLKPIAELF
jgi:hypothetical protein